VDVSDAEQVFAAAERVERELGPIDVWINNAMTTVFGPVRSISPTEFRRVTDVTYHGFVWGTQAALSRMRPRNRGMILQVGSALSYRGIALQAAYCGAKHAVRAFTDSLRCELIHEGVDIKLTMVQLPAVNTPQFRHCLNKMEYEPQPVPPIFQPEVIAETIYYAVHHPRREVYVGHPTIEAVIGNKLAPGILDHLLASSTWEGQFTEQHADHGRPSNLFAPVDVDAGAHGAFDARSRTRDWTSSFAPWLGAAGVRVLVAMIAPLWAMAVFLHRWLSREKPETEPRGA
jgi:NAD(P)-dependent dehydrogenase (short-subunit alcohol dehydrogenase family)